METFITISNFLIFGLIIITPILILIILKRLKTKQTLIVYFLINLFVPGVLIAIFAWWSYASDLILLEHYGYNIDGMNETEFYRRVLPEDMDKVDDIVTSFMGIGWPLKAFFLYVEFIPYFILVYIVKILIERFSNKISRPDNRYNQ